jgi:regulatory protein
MFDRNKGDLLDFGQAYRKAADYCALQDRCISEIQLKLNYWNINSSFNSEIINILVAEGFLDEKRFAINYAGGKFRINGWGKLKIAAGLTNRAIPAELIQLALSLIETEDYTRFLSDLLKKKLKQLGGNTPANRKKVIAFAASRGFELALIGAIVKNHESPEL